MVDDVKGNTKATTNHNNLLVGSSSGADLFVKHALTADDKLAHGNKKIVLDSNKLLLDSAKLLLESANLLLESFDLVCGRCKSTTSKRSVSQTKNCRQQVVNKPFVKMTYRA